MYAMLHIEASGNVTQEEYVTQNSAIYEGVEGRGGNGYVVKKDNLVLEEWFGSN